MGTMNTGQEKKVSLGQKTIMLDIEVVYKVRQIPWG